MKKILLIIAVLFISINTSYAQIDKDVITQKSEAFSKKLDNVATVVLVSDDSDKVVVATGYANQLDEKSAKSKNLFEIGSASKMFTAISVLQLIEQGKLSLDTPISKFYKDEKIKNLANFKGENHWNDVTVAMLLNHTSGFIDYLNVYGDDEKSMKMYAIKGKVYSFNEIISLAVDHGDANFAPGEKFKYSNTGYILLGDIIGKVSGVNWKDYVQEHILDVAGMKHTYFGSTISKKHKKHVIQGYFKGQPSFMPATLAGSAGELISNVKDLEKFLKAWQGGKLFQKEETLEMQRTKGFNSMYEETDTLKYGYGVTLIGGFYGHNGQTFGFQSSVFYNPEKKKANVIVVNSANADAILLFLDLEGLSLF